jgi:hypothetical protein
MRRLLVVLVTVVVATVAVAPAAEAAVFYLKNKNGMHMTGKRIKYLSKQVLHRKYGNRKAPLLFCNAHGYSHGSCDFLLNSKAGNQWCGNTYVRAYPKVVKIVTRGSRQCSDF